MKLKLVVLAALAALMVGSVPALAGQFGSRVTIREAADSSDLHGRVISDKRKCRVHRDVALFWDAPGPPRGDFQQVTGDFTNDRGRWVTPSPGGPVPPGRYYAKALRKDECAPAKSRTIRVD